MLVLLRQPPEAIGRGVVRNSVQEFGATQRLLSPPEVDGAEVVVDPESLKP
jgi:hypothetical protein